MVASLARSKAQARILAELIAPDCDDAVGISQQLLAAFGSLSRVMTATPDAIERQVGDRRIGQLIGAAQKAVTAGQRELIVRSCFDLRDERLQRYVHNLFQGLSHERLHVIFLDHQHRYLTDERLADGHCGQVHAALPALVARALDLGAGGIVLAHNHPSGVAEPSDADLKATQRLLTSLADVGFVLADHLIVGGMTIFSMRGAGLL